MQLDLTFQELDLLHRSLNLAIDRYAALLRGEGDTEAARLVTAEIGAFNELKTRIIRVKLAVA